MEAQPTLEEVLGAEGLPAEDALAPRLRRLVDEALATYAALVEPRAVCEELTPEAFAAVLAPVVPVTSAELVVGRIVPKAQALALYVATLGEALPARIRRLFDEDALAEGYMLDAVASVGADLLSDLLAERFEASARRPRARRRRVLPYSPGYCGWPTSGAEAALRRAAPGRDRRDAQRLVPHVAGEVGLRASSSPVPATAHRFRPDFPFCRECQTHDCGRRMASVLKR